MRRVLATVVGLVGLLGSASAEEKDCRLALITVEGEAEVRATPNEFVLHLGVETRGLDLAAATRANDEAVAQILRGAREAGVSEKQTQTGYMNVRPVHDEQRERARPLNLLGYVVERSIVLTVEDPKKVSGIRTAAVQAGANRLYGLQMRTSELRKHRDQARLLAVRAALEKAKAIAAELGQKIGRAHRIELDQPSGGGGRGFATNMNAMMQNVSVASGGEADSDEAFAPGQISIKAQVKVDFLLE